MSLILIFLLSLYSQAETKNSCGKDKIDLYYANGMSNDFVEAQKSALILKELYNQKFKEVKLSKIQLAFNSNESWLNQLHQVLNQKLSKLKISLWSYLNSKLISSPQINKIISKHLSISFNKTDSDLFKQTDNYSKSLSNFKDVVTVAHSQGNFYTNLAFNLIQSKQTHMISVATPDSEVYNSNPPLYYTFSNDYVIKFIPNALKGNITPSKPSGLNHSFVNHYLNDVTTKDKILDNIFAFNSKAEQEIQGFKSSDGHYNSNLNYLLDWFNNTKETKSKISDSDCLLASTIIYAFEFHDIECHERNEKMIMTMLNDCENDINSKFETNKTLCPYYSGLKIFENRSAQTVNLDIENFYTNHKECEFGYHEFETKDISIVTEAKRKLAELKSNLM